MNENELVFENEQYATTMTVEGKGEGREYGEPRLRCAVSFTLLVKETEKEIAFRGNVYWNAKYPKTHLFFTGGSLVDFISGQGADYAHFKATYWDKVKRLASNVFTDEEILTYQKMMDSVEA